MLDYFWKSKEHVVTTEAFERLISDPDKFGKSLTTLRKRKDRLNDDFSEQGVPIEIVPLKKAALRMIRNSE